MIITVDLPDSYIDFIEQRMLDTSMDQDQIIRAALREYQVSLNPTLPRKSLMETFEEKE